MKASITFISYCPDVVRGETFRIGLILRCDEAGFYRARISEHRTKRIAKAFGARDSVLLKETIHSHGKKQFDESYLRYFADYENGIVRYSKPQTIATDNPDATFGQLYAAYIQDPDEAKQPRIRSNTKFHAILRQNRVIKERYNIGFTLKPEMTGQLLSKNHKVDLIGKNSVVYIGQMPSLNDDDSITQCLMTFRAAEKHFSKQNSYHPKGCMMIVQSPAGITDEQQRRRETLYRWKEEAEYTLIERESPETLAEVIVDMALTNNIHPFTPETPSLV